jgi:steroid delta-isomerase-like uncharacterized protein
MLTPLEVARAYFDQVWTHRRREAIKEFSAPYAVGYLAFGGTKHISDVEQFHAALIAACPDIQVLPEQMISTGEHVCVRWIAKGTHTQTMFGIPAKNRAFEVRGATWFRVVDGKIVEAWDLWDQGGLLMRWSE